MTFRTEAELVRASSGAQDLTNLCKAYLKLWRQYANGKKGVTVPASHYTLAFRPMSEGHIEFVIVSTGTNYWEEPEYYDVDSDYFSESWGSSNISGYRTRSEDVINECAVRIPFACLLLSKEDMEASVKKVSERIAQQEVVDEKARKIAELEKSLAELKSNPLAATTGDHP